ncbi:MAG: hypothetical protein ABGW78_12325 [Pirellulales bacterium]
MAHKGVLKTMHMRIPQQIFSFLRLGLFVSLSFAAVVVFGNQSQVVVRLDVEGELIAATGRGTEPIRQPIHVRGKFEFTEPQKPSAETTREYSDAYAVIAIDNQSKDIKLPEDARLITVTKVGNSAAHYLDQGFLSREENDLLDIPFDSILLDALLPKDAVHIGESWTLAPGDSAGLLTIDVIESGQLKVTLEEVMDGLARMSLRGRLEGAVDGVSTEIAVEGHFETNTVASDSTTAAISNNSSPQYLLDQHIHAVTCTIQEQRQSSHVAPGFEVDAKIKVLRTPLTLPTTQRDLSSQTGNHATIEISDTSSHRRQGNGRPDRLWFRSLDGQFDLLYDARWRIVERSSDTLVMRLVDQGALVAQCSITTLPHTSASDTPTMQEVKRDLKRSLQEQFEGFEETSERMLDGLSVIRIASIGTADSLPFRWVHYVLADTFGGRMSVAFMMEESMTRRFGSSDEELIHNLRLLRGPEKAFGDPRQARLRRKTVTP